MHKYIYYTNKSATHKEVKNPTLLPAMDIFTKSFSISNKNISFAFDKKQGDLAQLARAPRWQRGGHGFESRSLHSNYK